MDVKEVAELLSSKEKTVSVAEADTCGLIALTFSLPATRAGDNERIVGTAITAPPFAARPSELYSMGDHRTLNCECSRNFVRDPGAC